MTDAEFVAAYAQFIKTNAPAGPPGPPGPPAPAPAPAPVPVPPPPAPAPAPVPVPPPPAPAPAPVPPPPPPPAPPPAPPPPAGDIVDASGAVVPSAYRAMAYQLVQTAGLIYRFGLPATATVPTLPERLDAGAINHGGTNNIYFAFGPENNTDANLYVSIHGTVIGKPNANNSLADAVRWFQATAVDRETWQQRPQWLWQDNTPLPPDVSHYESRNEVEFNDPADLPVCEYRGENAADSPSTRLSLICTQGSTTRPARMFSTGTYTAHNEAICTFALGMVPTGISVTGGGEFALVSMWDTITTRGKVAVVALGSTSQGSVLYGSRYDWWHGWMDMMHPGFVDQGNYIFMKVIGYVDLPDNCRAPTSIAVTTGVHPYTSALKYDASGQISSFQLMSSPMADNRAKLLPGGEDYERYAKGGVALVSSRSEKTVCFIDLGPLFAYTNDMYLGSVAKNLETQKMGQGALQWEYLLADHREASPVVVKTIVLPKRPAAVLTTATRSYWDKDAQERIPGASGPPFFRTVPRFARAWVATVDGDLYIYSLGRYAAGVKPTQPVPADIAQVGLVTGLGANITHLAACKGHPDVSDPLNDSVVYTARADRRIGLVKFNTTADGLSSTGTVQSIIQDSRIDPVMATIADNYSTVGNVLCVADYSGSRVCNFRFGPVTYAGSAPWSPAATMSPSGEYCGGLALPCKPFSVHSSNTP